MLTKNDLIILLTNLQDKGEDVTKYLEEVITSPTIPMDALKFVNDRRQLEVANFYETLRKKYNNKKSDLYINIVKEVEDPNEVLTTLASFNLQALLFSKKIDNSTMFYKHARLDELTKCLYSYYNNYDLIPCIKLLKLIKADLKAFESIK